MLFGLGRNIFFFVVLGESLDKFGLLLGGQFLDLGGEVLGGHKPGEVECDNPLKPGVIALGGRQDPAFGEGEVGLVDLGQLGLPGEEPGPLILGVEPGLEVLEPVDVLRYEVLVEPAQEGLRVRNVGLGGLKIEFHTGEQEPGLGGLILEVGAGGELGEVEGDVLLGHDGIL